MGDECGPRGVEEAERPWDLVAGLEGLEDGFVVIQTRIPVPGHPHEARVVPHRAQAFEGLGMPAACGIGWDIVAMNHDDPSVGRFPIGQPRRFINLVQSWFFWSFGGTTGKFPGHSA